MYDEFFSKAHELLGKGVPFVTATVVRAENPTSAKPGDKAIVTMDGVMHGWIGGSCAQPSVVREALRALADGESRLVRLSPDPEREPYRPGVIDLPMTCFSGGTLEVFIQPQHPRPRLLIVGALPVAQALAHLGKAMNYQVVAVVLQEETGAMAHADVILEDLEGVAGYINAQTYTVIATHGNYDELALTKILAVNPGYVGLVASPKRAESVRDYLRLHGFSDTELLPLKAPAGLDIQARRGDEIALSIMAEIVQRRRNAELLDVALLKEMEDVSDAEEKTPTGTPTTVIDPICHMSVEIATAVYTSDYKGQRFYFCCAGCQTRFERDPATYVEQAETFHTGRER